MTIEKSPRNSTDRQTNKQDEQTQYKAAKDNNLSVPFDYSQMPRLQCCPLAVVEWHDPLYCPPADGAFLWLRQG